MSYRPCSNVEEHLRAYGVKFKYHEAIPYSELMEGWSDHNLGRPKARVEEAVCSYADLMDKGSPAPGVVTRKLPGKQGLEVLDGCQRLMGGELLGFLHFGGYIVECSQKTAELLRSCINLRMQGAAPVDEEKTIRELVKRYIMNGNYSQRELAEACGRRVDTIRDVYKTEQSLDRYDNALTKTVDEIGFVPFKKKVSQSMVKALHNKTQSSDWDAAHVPLVKFLDACTRGGYTNGDSKEILSTFTDNVRRSSRKDCEQSYLRNLNVVYQKFPDFARRVTNKKKAPIDKIVSAMRTLVTCCREAVDDNCCVEGEIALSLDEDWREAARLCRQMLTTKYRQDGCFECTKKR